MGCCSYRKVISRLHRILKMKIDKILFITLKYPLCIFLIDISDLRKEIDNNEVTKEVKFLKEYAIYNKEFTQKL
jgi:hypothetical protein